MAIKPSGTPLAFSEIQAEFGGANPLSLSQYYRGGGRVPDGPTANNGIATSGAINMGGFYGATNRVPINITISANQTNYVLNTAKAAGYVAGVSDITLTINSGVYCSSNTVGTPGLDVDTSWAAGDTVTIVNSGFIVGRGGGGGNGSYVNVAGSAGAAGGLSFRAQRPVAFNNAGTIAGGGGGGGGGQGGWTLGSYGEVTYSVGGGGGGGGRSSAAVNSTGGSTSWGGYPGGAGTVASAGAGGAGGANVNVAGAGGNGGGWGAGGATGGGCPAPYPTGGPYSGGSAGAAVSGNSNITWVATGTRLGAIT